MAKLTDKLFNRVIEGEMLPVVSISEREIQEGKFDKLENLKVGDLFIIDELLTLVLRNTEEELIGLQGDDAIYQVIISKIDDSIDYKKYFSADDSELTSELLTALTHSFNELDETLRGIVTNAIEDNFQNGVICTGAQWEVIKALLDKSLYINYTNYNLIKTLSDGIHLYCFGSYSGHNVGALLEFNYDVNAELLFADFLEM